MEVVVLDSHESINRVYHEFCTGRAANERDITVIILFSSPLFEGTYLTDTENADLLRLMEKIGSLDSIKHLHVNGEYHHDNDAPVEAVTRILMNTTHLKKISTGDSISLDGDQNAFYDFGRSLSRQLALESIDFRHSSYPSDDPSNPCVNAPSLMRTAFHVLGSMKTLEHITYKIHQDVFAENDPGPIACDDDLRAILQLPNLKKFDIDWNLFDDDNIDLLADLSGILWRVGFSEIGRKGGEELLRIVCNEGSLNAKFLLLRFHSFKNDARFEPKIFLDTLIQAIDKNCPSLERLLLYIQKGYAESVFPAIRMMLRSNFQLEEVQVIETWFDETNFLYWEEVEDKEIDFLVETNNSLGRGKLVSQDISDHEKSTLWYRMMQEAGNDLDLVYSLIRGLPFDFVNLCNHFNMNFEEKMAETTCVKPKKLQKNSHNSTS